MNVFLTGGTGVVGTRALPVLVAAGHRVTAVARSDAKATLVREMGGTPVGVDLFDPDAVKAAVDGHDAVVNLATHIPPLSRAALSSAWATNDRLRTEAAGYLVDAALATGADRFVQESITFPYVDGGDRWLDEDTERTREGPMAAPSVAEAHAGRFAADGGTATVLRFAAFYAPDSSQTVTFEKLLRLGINPFVGPADAYFSSISAVDAGAAVAAALEAPGGTYNVADDEPLTRAAAGADVAAVLGRRRARTIPRALLAPMAAKMGPLLRSQRVSNRRLRDASGWAPRFPSLGDGWPGGDR